MTGTSAANSAASTSAQSAIQKPRPCSGAPIRPIVTVPRAARARVGNAFATTSHDDKRIIWGSR